MYAHQEYSTCSVTEKFLANDDESLQMQPDTRTPDCMSRVHAWLQSHLMAHVSSAAINQRGAEWKRYLCSLLVRDRLLIGHPTRLCPCQGHSGPMCMWGLLMLVWLGMRHLPEPHSLSSTAFCSLHLLYYW